MYYYDMNANIMFMYYYDIQVFVHNGILIVLITGDYSNCCSIIGLIGQRLFVAEISVLPISFNPCVY